MSNVFESISENSSKASDLGEKYLKTTQDYVKLKIFQQLTISISLIGKMILVGSLLFIGSLFLAITLAVALGYLVGNFAIGSLIVGALFFILAFIGYKIRHRINNKVIEKMSDKFFNS